MGRRSGRIRRRSDWGAALVLAAALVANGAQAQTDAPSLSEPFAVELKAKRPDLPQPFAVKLKATRPNLLEPFAVELKARRPDLPEPFAVELKAKRPDLPEPFAVELKARRPELPEPIAVVLRAKRPDLPEPFAVDLKAKRPELPVPFAVTLKARRAAKPTAEEEEEEETRTPEEPEVAGPDCDTLQQTFYAALAEGAFGIARDAIAGGRAAKPPCDFVAAAEQNLQLAEQAAGQGPETEEEPAQDPALAQYCEDARAYITARASKGDLDEAWRVLAQAQGAGCEDLPEVQVAAAPPEPSAPTTTPEPATQPGPTTPPAVGCERYAAEAGRWRGPWMGTIKLTELKVNGQPTAVAAFNAKLEGEWQRYLREQEKEKKDEGPAGGLGSALGEAFGGIGTVIVAAVKVVAQAGLEWAEHGILVSFALEPGACEYRLRVLGMPAEPPKTEKGKKKQERVLFQYARNLGPIRFEGSNMLRGNFRDPSGKGQIYIALSMADETTGFLHLEAGASGTYPDDPTDPRPIGQAIRSVSYRTRGELQPGAATYGDLDALWAREIKPYMEKYMPPKTN